MESPPVYDATSLSNAEARRIYNEMQLLHVRGVFNRNTQQTMQFGFDGLVDLYGRLRSHVEKSFVIENGDPDLTAQAVLAKPRPAGDWYASFIFQEREHLPGLLGALPLSCPWFFDEDVSHSACVWLFFGQNFGKAMRGRKEHVDLVSNDGTWHGLLSFFDVVCLLALILIYIAVQMSGSKTWHVRPNLEATWPHKHPQVLQKWHVHLQPGDLLMINTRLWFHETEIPSTNSASDRLSFSYARDFFLQKASNRETEGAAGAAAEREEQDERGSGLLMSNLEGPWATRAIGEGDVIEHEAPLCCDQSRENRERFICCEMCYR